LEFLTLEERISQGEVVLREEQNDAQVFFIPNGIEISVAKLPE